MTLISKQLSTCRNNKQYMKLNLSTVWTDDAMLIRAFTWLTRVGAGRKFGSLPVGWYQMHQCACIDILTGLGATEVSCKSGIIQWKVEGEVKTISANDLFTMADNQVRK